MAKTIYLLIVCAVQVCIGDVLKPYKIPEAGIGMDARHIVHIDGTPYMVSLPTEETTKKPSLDMVKPTIKPVMPSLIEGQKYELAVEEIVAERPLTDGLKLLQPYKISYLRPIMPMPMPIVTPPAVKNPLRMHLKPKPVVNTEEYKVVPYIHTPMIQLEDQKPVKTPVKLEEVVLSPEDLKKISLLPLLTPLATLTPIASQYAAIKPYLDFMNQFGSMFGYRLPFMNNKKDDTKRFNKLSLDEEGQWGYLQSRGYGRTDALLPVEKDLPEEREEEKEKH